MLLRSNPRLTTCLLTALAASTSGFTRSVIARRAFGERSNTIRATTAIGSTVVDATDVSKAMTKLEDVSESYKVLISKLKTITQLSRCQSVLGYDQMVFMPKNPSTAGERGAQMAALSGVIHEMKTSKDVYDLIIKSEEDLAAAKGVAFKDEARLLELEKKAFLENERVPVELAKRAAALGARANQAWEIARKNNDFSSFEPVLRECFDTAREMADAKRGGPESSTPLYTQMLDQFEVGMAKERIDVVFKEIREALVPLIGKVLASNEAPSTECLKGDFPCDKQADIAKTLVTAIGYNDERGRIDVSTHPFTSASSTSDVRVTSRFTEGEWREGLIATLHEGGHAIYEQNINPSSLKIDASFSMGTHESQSLFWEKHIGLSKAFWRYATPLMQDTFGEGFGYTPEDVYGAVNFVAPSLIRVEADELTYPLHVILRYEIETDVIEGNLDIKDVPERWNKDMKEFLNVDVPSDADGCLQDIHWSAMAIGYFPTYLIGSATAAQIAYHCKKDIPDFEQLVEQGQFSKIREWLTDKIHRHGQRYKSLDDLLEAQLGEKLNPKYFIDYLTKKYSDLYKL